MKKAILPILFAATSALAAGEPGNLSNNINGLIGAPPPPPSSSANVMILDERDLLRAYLAEVERRSDAEVNEQLARMDLQRDVFNAYNERWWANYQDQQLKERSRLYWGTFREGSNYADDLLRTHGAGNNSCLLLRQLVDKTTEPNLPSGPITDADLGEAFRRGVVADAPECFIDNLTDKVKAFFTELGGIDQRLFEINVNVQGFIPDERAVENVYRTLEKTLKDAADTYVDETQPKIAKSVGLEPARVAKIQGLAQLIASTVNCATLKGPSNQPLSCNFRIADSRKPVDRNAAYKILFSNEALGDYQQHLDFQDLFLAARTFQQLNPQNRMVSVQVGGLQNELNELDRVVSASVDNMRKAARIALSDRLRDVRLDNIDVWRSLFNRDVATEMVRMFFTLRERILMYERLDMATRVEANMLGQVKDLYNHALNQAAGVALTVNLPKRAVTVQLDDLENTLIELPFDVSTPPSGFLLGRDAQQVNFWTNYLRL